MREQYLAARSLIRKLKRSNPNDSFYDFGFPCRVRWAIQKANSIANNLETELAAQALRMISERNTLQSIHRETGLPMRKIEHLSKQFRREQWAQIRGTHASKAIFPPSIDKIR